MRRTVGLDAPTTGRARLEVLLERISGEPSGGQRQRTVLALVKRAALVLLAEPLANLDHSLRPDLCQELRRILAETGAVFACATTDCLAGGRR